MMNRQVVVLACEKCKKEALEMMQVKRTCVSIGYSLSHDKEENRYIRVYPEDVVSVKLERYHDDRN